MFRKLAVLAGTVAIGSLVIVGCDEDVTPTPPDPMAEALASARAATAKYVDAPVSVAEADGFVAAGPCTESPAGGMGFHYVHMQRFMQPPRADAPAGLLYHLDSSGELKLAGVEYFLAITHNGQPYVHESEPPPDASIPPRPEIFPGKPFEGPMAGHDPNMPWHYDQHVWLYEENPNGMFAQWNPSVDCPDVPQDGGPDAEDGEGGFIDLDGAVPDVIDLDGDLLDGDLLDGDLTDASVD